MRKILIYTMTMIYGGAERVISNLVNYLCQNNQIILVTNIKTDSSYKLNSKIKYINIDTKDKSKEFILKKIITKLSFKRTKELEKIILKYKPDVVISFLPEPTMRALSLKRKSLKDIPVVVAVRNDPRFEYNFPFGKLIRNFYYKRADKFVFQTKSYLKYFNDKIIKNAYIIPNMISDEYLIDTYKYKRNKKIVSVGRLEKQKNYKLLINSFNNLSSKYKDYKLEIYGNGKEFGNIQKYINKLSLNDRVKIYRGVKDIKSKIYNASLFVLSSKYEGVSNSLIEAMALGIPVIATNSSLGIKDLLYNNKIGLLVKNNDATQLTKKMEFALNEEENKKLSKQSYKIRDLLNNKEILEKWENVLK